MRARPGRARWLAAGSGVAAAVVVLFKHLYLPIALVFVVHAVWRLHRHGRTRTGAALVGWWSAGLAVGVAPFVAWVVATHQVRRVLWTYVVATSSMRSLAPPPAGRLAHSLVHAGIVAAPLVVLAWVGRRRAWRTANRAGTIDLLAWVVVGEVALAPQLWWSYQQLLVVAPLGLLAAHGVDELASTADCARGTSRFGRWSRAAAVIGVAAATAVALTPAAARLAPLARHRFAVTTADRADLRMTLEPAETEAVAAAKLLRDASSRAGRLLVVGNPITLLRSGREQAGAVHGWSPEFDTPSLWRETADAAADPATAYVAIDRQQVAIVSSRGSSLERVLADEYRRLPPVAGSSFAWWVRIAP